MAPQELSKSRNDELIPRRQIILAGLAVLALHRSVSERTRGEAAPLSGERTLLSVLNDKLSLHLNLKKLDAGIIWIGAGIPIASFFFRKIFIPAIVEYKEEFSKLLEDSE